MLNQQLKSCAQELDVPLNSNALLQSAFLRARLAAMHQNHTCTPNLIHAASRYLGTIGMHLRDADQPIITNTLQTFLHHTDNPLLLGRHSRQPRPQNPMHFNISSDGPTHLPFVHRKALHNSLTKLVSTLPTHPVAITFHHPRICPAYTHLLQSPRR